MSRRTLFGGAIALVLVATAAADDETAFEFGFDKRDITPDVSLRLSGYGNRAEVSSGIDESLFVRAMAVRPADAPVRVIVSVDTIGLSGALTRSIAERIEREHGVIRSRFVVCCTHSHTAPHLVPGLDNLFAVPMTDSQKSESRKYTLRVADQIVAAAGAAIGDLKPGRLWSAEGRVEFAHNRRVLKDGSWIGFGDDAAGPIDHSLPVLKVTDEKGMVRGVLFNYACHCTTFGGGYNRVNGDWAGYASKYIEAAVPGATALCTIGCGGDQNPTRSDDPEEALRLAKAHGREIAEQVSRVTEGDMHEVTAAMSDSFGYAGLPVDRPSTADLRKALDDRSPQVRRHAQNMIELERRMGRLPETYPAPVQVWRFGDQLCMVFLGGEVVVDYALRIKREIPARQMWVTAYANDVFGYVASERMRKEGGYEVTGSMIYYNQPGPWAEGTEEVLMRRVRELAEQGSFAGPFSPEEALETFRIDPRYEIGIVAAEPLIADPVHFSVGADGCLWVVEMGDYPRGTDDQGKPGGRIKRLKDIDGDGRYDESTVFLEDLSFPNSVFPWRNGVVVCCAPSILYAEDSDGDGKADVRRDLFTGLVEANPQHRTSGFAWGLDNWIHLAGGADNGEIKSEVTGRALKVSSHDFKIRVDTGEARIAGGHTQFGRNRDDWGNWFGGDNSHPIVHFVFGDDYSGRNPFYSPPKSSVHLHSPATAPPVFPASRTLDRFNDLFALNRFTSACSPMIFRDSTLGPEMHGAALISEPVHNLVHRALLTRDGVTFRAVRNPDEQDREFLGSTDHWFRPTTIATGPDGSLWVADMYRSVIEHPQWIPESWQAKLDLRAGDRRGRIYRVYARADGPGTIPDLASMSSVELVSQLDSSNGWRRDTAQRLLIEQADDSMDEEVLEALANLPRAARRPVGKVHSLATLDGLGRLRPEHLLTALADQDPRVRRLAIRLSDRFLNEHPQVGKRLVSMTGEEDPAVRMQLALTLGEWDDPAAARALVELLTHTKADDWITAAVLSSAGPHALNMLPRLLERADGGGDSDTIQHLIATALGSDEQVGMERILSAIVGEGEDTQNWRFEALAGFDRALRRRGSGLGKLVEQAAEPEKPPYSIVTRLSEVARREASDGKELSRRLAAVRLLGRASGDAERDRVLLGNLMTPREPLEIQLAAIENLAANDELDVADHLLTNWRQLSPGVQSHVISALLSTPQRQAKLLDAMESGRVSPADFDSATRARLLSQGDAETTDRARRLLGPPVDEDRRKVIRQYETVGQLTGDPRLGAEHFRKSCSACHRHNGIGNEIGPALSALTDKSDENLLVAVLDPNRAVEGKYKSYTCVTRDGRQFTGMLVEETSSGLTLAEANGNRRTFLRVDIESLVGSGISMMPVGLEKELTPQALADVFRFLREPGQ